jgi:F420-non-reducing hydrogenase small subunit
MRARVSTEWLAGCSGCHVAVVDLHEKLLGLVEEVEFVRIPVLLDEKGYPKADVGLVEGAVRTAHDRECLEAMRKSVKTLVAFGSCAAYGGPSGLGWLYRGQEVVEQVYAHAPTDADGALPDARAPRLEERVVPIDAIVDVDLYLPGCPPHPYFIAAGLRAALGLEAPALTEKTVCAECTRRMEKRSLGQITKGAVTVADPEVCFLSQGVVCLGSVTLNRCKSPCMAAGAPCIGCAGPSLQVLTEPQLDVRNLLARRMSKMCGVEPAAVTAYLEAEAKTFYAFTIASPLVHCKPTLALREWSAGETTGTSSGAGSEVRS